MEQYPRNPQRGTDADADADGDGMDQQALAEYPVGEVLNRHTHGIESRLGDSCAEADRKSEDERHGDAQREGVERRGAGLAVLRERPGHIAAGLLTKRHQAGGEAEIEEHHACQGHRDAIDKDVAPADLPPQAAAGPAPTAVPAVRWHAARRESREKVFPGASRLHLAEAPAALRPLHGRSDRLEADILSEGYQAELDSLSVRTGSDSRCCNAGVI